MLNIALDGPGGAGKSTIAKAVAARLGIVYVDTGALYRTIGLHVRRRNADPSECAAVEALLPEISLEIRYEDGGQQVYLNGTCVGDAIRTPEMSHYASAVSVHPPVRAFLLETQRKIARENSVIMDGRDIGTVIMPDADLKVFLTASPEERARRRFAELQAKGDSCTYEEVLADIIKRDANDTGRDIAPAVAADDALMFDNTGMGLEETVKKIGDMAKAAVKGEYHE